MNVNPVLGFIEYFNLVDKKDYKKSIADLTQCKYTTDSRNIIWLCSAQLRKPCLKYSLG